MEIEARSISELSVFGLKQLISEAVKEGIVKGLREYDIERSSKEIKNM